MMTALTNIIILGAVIKDKEGFPNSCAFVDANKISHSEMQGFEQKENQ